MYAKFFGLKQPPFSIAPDPRYLYMSERHREALAHLLYGLKGGGGFVLLTGEIGAGKTTVCRCFLEQLPPRCNVAYIFNPKLTVPELLQTVCDEFRIPPPALPPGAERTVKAYIDPLNEFLLRTHAVGQTNVLIIDEAQNLSPDVLEQLRLLTNLETAERKLLQIILIGQPELRDMLARPELEQLAQRVIARYHLGPLNADETALYVQHRLGVAGGSGACPFDAAALERIHQCARGVPRRINLLCDRALLGGYATGQQRIGADVVARAAGEVFGTPGPGVRRGGWRARPALPWAGGAVAGLALAAVAWGLWPAAPGPDPAAVAHGTGNAPSTANRSGTPAGATDAASPTGPAPRVAGAGADAGRAAAPDDRAAEPLPFSAAQATAPGPGAAGVDARRAVTSGLPVAKAAPLDALDADELRAAFASQLNGEPDARRELAAAWGLALPAGGDVCSAAARQGVLCFKGASSLAMVRQLGRPGLLTLHDGRGRPYQVLLAALGDDRAVLQRGERRLTVPLASLGAAWRGEFLTLWRAPESYAGPTTLANPGSDGARWLAERLAQAQPAHAGADAPLPARVAAFQVAQGLPPDGVPGPMTLMLLNRATGVDEPRLGGPAARP